MRTLSKWVLTGGLALGSIITVPVAVMAGVLDVAWTAPTTNTDGSPLTDLASYRVYYATGAPCPGPTFLQVGSPTSAPGPGQMVSVRLTGLTTNTTYNIAVTAIDTSGNQSTCSGTVSGTASLSLSVTPSGSVSFGNVMVGSTADRVFTIQNTRTGSVSGTASASGAFRVVSGSPFTLPGSGSTQVTVRFTPTSVATSTTSVSFAADGDSVSRSVTGTGIVADVTPPTVTITQPAGATYTTSSTSVTLTGTASDNVGVTQVVWANNRGGGGTAAGTSAWTAAVTGLRLGQNVLTVTAQDTANLTASTTLTVRLSLAFSFTDDPLVAQTSVQAIHFTELRAAIDAVRGVCGLQPYGWTDPALTPGSFPIRAVHLSELRTALSEAYQAVGKPIPTYTDASLEPGATSVKAIHLNEVRAAVRGL